LIFAVFPLIDLVAGIDWRNPSDEVIAHLEQDPYYRWCLYAFLPLQYAGLVFAAYLWTRADLTAVDKLGLALTVGMVAGIGINAAHELGHKRTTIEKRLAKVALAQSAYGHFFVEHNRGHHVRVSTLEDPASARYGESFWRFLPRTVAGSLRSAWGLERRRLRGAGFRTFSWRNDVLSAWFLTALLFAALTVGFGTEILPYLLIQAAVGAALLEVVNYLEHWGLLRERRPDGRYEIVRPEHSWNSNNVASNVLLYHLQRHSDHHANPLRRYQALRHVEEAPQLPTGLRRDDRARGAAAGLATGDGAAIAGALRRRPGAGEQVAVAARFVQAVWRDAGLTEWAGAEGGTGAGGLAVRSEPAGHGCSRRRPRRLPVVSLTVYGPFGPDPSYAMCSTRDVAYTRQACPGSSPGPPPANPSATRFKLPRLARPLPADHRRAGCAPVSDNG
jgi:alkane 1-monooxygenase